MPFKDDQGNEHPFFFELPVIITRPGKYRTRCNEIVTITSTGRGLVSEPWGAVGTFPEGIEDRWNVNGRRTSMAENKHDIVEGPLDHTCPNGEKPQVVTCGRCGKAWCERCDPAPSALCHYCNGRGSSLAPALSE